MKLNSESSSVEEGTIYYDVCFNAVAPANGEPITLIVNLEIQTDDKPGYELVTRGTYWRKTSIKFDFCAYIKY